MTTLFIGYGKPKREIVQTAYSDAGLSDAEFAIEPEELTQGLRKLNAMMLEWPWNLMGYEQPPYGAGNLDDPSGLDDEAVNAATMALAFRLAAGMGKMLSPDVKGRFAVSMSQLRAKYATVPTMQLPRDTVRGSGVSRWSPFSIIG